MSKNVILAEFQFGSSETRPDACITQTNPNNVCLLVMTEASKPEFVLIAQSLGLQSLPEWGVMQVGAKMAKNEQK